MIEINQKLLRTCWRNNKPINYNNRQYRVGRMSYDQYFLEPVEFQGSEIDGHSPDTIWLERIPKTDSYQEEV